MKTIPCSKCGMSYQTVYKTSTYDSQEMGTECPKCQEDEGEFGVDRLVGNGPDDCEWEGVEEFSSKDEAISKAKSLSKNPGILQNLLRVIDLRSGKEVWSNC